MATGDLTCGVCNRPMYMCVCKKVFKDCQNPRYEPGLLNRVFCADENYCIKKDHVAKFPVGSLVTLESRTFEVVYSNDECLVIEPRAVLKIKGKGQT